MQMIQQNLPYILGGTLLFLVCSSKNILIYNEELLIALSFLAFIATSSQTMGDAISETFQTRADQIQTELQAFFVTKETMYHEVKRQIQMQQTLAHSMTALGTLVQHQLQDLHTQRAKALQNVVQTRTVTQLQQMVSQQNAVHAHMHTVTAQTYTHVMLEAMQLQQQHMQKLCMDNALQLLGTMKRKKVTQKHEETKKVDATQNTVKKTGNKAKKK